MCIGELLTKIKRIDTAGVRAIATMSYKTEDDVFRAHYEGRRSRERDDAGMRRGEEEERSVEEKMDGGDTGGN